MTEEWRDVVGYEGLYQVSNTGRVKSLYNNILLKPVKLKNGYLVVCLHKDGKQKNRHIHRLVAEAFLPNPNKFPVVMHLDDEKTNNNVWNLKWSTHSENHTHNGLSFRIGRKAGKTKSKPVIGINVNNPNDILILPSTAAGREYGFNQGNISNCCNRRNGQKTHKGYRWFWLKEVI